MTDRRYPVPITRGLPKKSTVGIVAVVGILLIGLGFIGGMEYQKSKSTASKTAQLGSAFGSSNDQSFGGGAPGSRRGMGGFGTVTAITDTSITISVQQFAGPGSSSSSDSTASKTYTITSSTTITDDGSDVTASDISVGDTVIVHTSSSSSTTATTIMVNPSMGPSNTSPSGNDTSTDSTDTGTSST